MYTQLNISIHMVYLSGDNLLRTRTSRKGKSTTNLPVLSQVVVFLNTVSYVISSPVVTRISSTVPVASTKSSTKSYL